MLGKFHRVQLDSDSRPSKQWADVFTAELLELTVVVVSTICGNLQAITCISFIFKGSLDLIIFGLAPPYTLFFHPVGLLWGGLPKFLC